MARSTIEKLAEMIVNEFQGLRQEIAGEFGDVRQTLADHSARLNRMEQKLDNTIGPVDDHGVRLPKLREEA